ncbi:MAG: hypothetical protein M1834_000580 [Cirrosporium novae-zelandiae]|nr:MAG: hypothetical protein M1834_000580 [Cirrosporium novae-zelandiae]
MPCFKGLAVSIHTPNGPLPEYSVQRQSRLGRITSYIPVPPAKVPLDVSKDTPEQSTFAISITLLTPGLNVPYSAPKPSPQNPYPKPKLVGPIPAPGERGKHAGAVAPYVPMTLSPNETIAAYIYFDGRQKEEVATLLRRGEETWVNSRWVSVPEKEGGGLAEREFLFREVGLERWLNGLDLEGKDAAATIERRRQKLEKKRRRRKHKTSDDDSSDMDLEAKARRHAKDVLRYGGDMQSPIEKVSDGEVSSSSSDDDDPIPETAGQIKVALFRVLASGDIKRGEYSPQFDAHDDDDDESKANGESNGDVDIDHTTSFAKPKTLDPKSISTQTVTGMDASDKPYAVFTFLYRGERQLQKMGILPSPKPEKTAPSSKRKSFQAEFENLAPLKSTGTVGFSTFRDPHAHTRHSGSFGKIKSEGDDDDDMESDDDDSSDQKDTKADEDDEKQEDYHLSPDDARRQRELAEGVKKIQLKRQRSADPMGPATPEVPTKTTKSNSGTPNTAATTPPITNTPPLAAHDGSLVDSAVQKALDENIIGSPFKKARASLSLDDETSRSRLSSAISGEINMPSARPTIKLQDDSDDEL